MSETRTHKNTNLCYIAHKDSSYYKVVDSEGTLLEYNTADWDMEVTFTRKVKPFPDGSLVLDTSDTTLFQKIDGRWFFVYLREADDEWTDYGLTDRTIRENKLGNYRVLHEPTE